MRQHLALNTDILFSLEVLRLPMQELKELLIQKAYDNPLLDAEEYPSYESTPALPAASDDPEARMLVSAFQNDIFSAGAAGKDVYFAAGCNEQSFVETLYEQLGALKLEDDFLELCRFLCASLDRRGYFTDPPEEIAELLNCPRSYLMRALEQIQRLEPAGVGARGLEECLLLQLQRREKYDEHATKLVESGMDLLASGNIKGIQALLKTDEASAREACNIVRTLNPIPSQGYYTGEARQTIVPDASVEKTAEGFSVAYNRRCLPQLRVNLDYARMIPSLDDSYAKEYLKQSLIEAHRLVKAVEKRESTLTRIVTRMVHLQHKFFEDGLSLDPMTLDTIATELELNISTISRAVNGKYIACAAGTLELKSLFTAGLKGEDGEIISAVTVKRMIKSLVNTENAAKPMSDEAIRNALKSAKMNISRRTVAKYREEMGIPASLSRKRA